MITLLSVIFYFFQKSNHPSNKFSITSNTNNIINPHITKTTSTFLQHNCSQCHANFNESNSDLLIEKAYIIPGNPEKSLLFQYTRGSWTEGPQSMPPLGDVSPREIQEFANWIKNLKKDQTQDSVSLAASGIERQLAPSPLHPLSELNIYQRCFTHFSKLRFPRLNTDQRLQRIQSKKLKGTDACLELLKIALLDQQGNLQKNEEGQLAQKILSNFQSFHNNWFSAFDFFFGNNDGGTFEVLDPGLMGFYVTRTLFTNDLPLKTIFSETDSFEAARMAKKLNQFTVHPLKRTNIEKAYFLTGAYDKGFEYWRPHYVERGELYGIRKIPKRRDILPKVAHYTADQADAREHSISFANKDIHENHGGGILGSEQYLILNNGMGLGITSDGGVNVPRLWGKAIIEDFLCRELPVITEQDALPFTQEKSALPFRKNANCMSCHVTMDYTSYVIRNMEKVYSTPMDVDSSDLLKTMHIFANKAGIKDLGYDFRPDEDPLFYKRPTKGVFVYRTLDDHFLQQKIDSLDDLGKILTDLDDFYYCVAKRYFHFLTGIEVVLDKIESKNANEKSQYFINLIKSLGKNLKQHQSLFKLIEEIIKTPVYRDQYFEINLN